MHIIIEDEFSRQRWTGSGPQFSLSSFLSQTGYSPLQDGAASNLRKSPPPTPDPQCTYHSYSLKKASNSRQCLHTTSINKSKSKCIQQQCSRYSSGRLIHWPRTIMLLLTPLPHQIPLISLPSQWGMLFSTLPWHTLPWHNPLAAESQSSIHIWRSVSKVVTR